MNKEEENIRNLMQDSQKNYFIGKISIGEYHQIMNQHQKRLSNIRKTRLTLRNKRIKILKPEQITQELEIEKLQVEEEIKKIQLSFYKEAKISEAEYKLQFKVLNERLAEIEGERITLELMKKRKEEKIKRMPETKEKKNLLTDLSKISKTQIEKNMQKIKIIRKNG